MEKLLLTPQEAAEALGVSRSQLYGLMRRHEVVSSMSRRTNGEGSVYRRADGRWTGAHYVLRPDGVRVRRAVYARTQREAVAKLAVLVAKTTVQASSASRWT